MLALSRRSSPDLAAPIDSLDPPSEPGSHLAVTGSRKALAQQWKEAPGQPADSPGRPRR